MSAHPGWLIDKSALARLHATPDQEAWMERIGCGLISIGADSAGAAPGSLS
ncbi:MAG: hypothetical protein LBE08_03555 [Bifidobacteriaceae bacterium]|nr:hypothetical protein [Bifidobacteriaceae bacterium]